MAEVHESAQDAGTATLPPGARCLHCDYLLADLPGRTCPECGRQFDPAEAMSYLSEGEDRWAARWRWRMRRWAAPPSLMHVVLSVTALVWLQETVWGPELQGRTNWSLHMRGSLTLGLVLGYAYWMRAITMSIWGVIGPRASRWRVRLGWWTFPLCTCLALLTPVLPVRLALSSPMLLFKSHSVIREGRSDNGRPWVGLYWFRRATLLPGGQVRFEFMGPRWEARGILYDPDGAGTWPSHRLLGPLYTVTW